MHHLHKSVVPHRRTLLTGWGLLLVTVFLLPEAWGQTKDAKPGEKKKGKQSVAERIEGEWTIVRGANRGQEVPQEELAGSLVVLKDNKLVVLDAEEQELYGAAYALKADAKPMEIDMRANTPNAPASVGLGIFQFTKEGWKLAYALPGAERPTDFKVRANAPVMLFELKRAPEPKEPPLAEVENPPAE